MKTNALILAINAIPELKKVEELILTKFNSDANVLSEISSYLLEIGGKRIRPLLTLLLAKAYGSKLSDELIKISAGIELIHMATILHDDIIDKSSLRRHQPSPLIKFGADHTLLAGDFLLVRAFGLCAELDQQIVKETEKACIALVEGEALEIPLNIKINHHQASLYICEKKTASLFELSGFCAASLSDCSENLINKSKIFGKNLGIAFQIIDDILDIIATKEELGKEPGTDIRERKPSMVNTLWLESGSKLAKKLSLEPDNQEEHFIAAAIDEIKDSAVLEQAREIAKKYITLAKEFVDQELQESEYKQLLNGILDFTTNRMV